MKFSEINASQIYLRLKIFFPISGGFIKLQKNHVEHFFQFLILNISSIKELLHKPSEIQWNITGTLPTKIKRTIIGLHPTRYFPLKSQKREKLLFLGYFGGLGTNVEFNGFFVILWISGSFSLYLLVKNSFFLIFHCAFFIVLSI